MLGRGSATELLRWRLRVAALLSLAADVLFVPLELHYRTALELPRVFVVWGVHIFLSVLALALSYSPVSARTLDRLIVVLTLGYVANAQAYLIASPTDVGLVSIGLTIVLMLSAVFFAWSWARTLVVAGIACTAFAVVGGLVSPGDGLGESPAELLAGLFVGATVAVASAAILGQFRMSLAEREAALAALSARLMALQEEERRRISHELHDEVGQSLSAVNAYLWLLDHDHLAADSALRDSTAEARRLIAKSLASIRELSGHLRPTVLDDFGLIPSLDAHLKAFGARHEITTSLEVDDVPERLPAEVEIALYRIAQEGLSNVARHAHARRVSVRLVAENHHIRLDIEDDGVGLPRAVEKHGMGLLGINERVRQLGGTVAIASGRGASLSIRLPLPAA